MRVLAALLVTGFLAGCAGSHALRGDEASQKQQVMDAANAWVAAYNSRDAARIAAMYEPDTVFWGTTSTTTSKAAPTTSAQAAGPNKTIVDYIKENGIVESPVHRGDAGAPTIDLPTPQGWEDAGGRTPQWAYGAIVSTDPTFAQGGDSFTAFTTSVSRCSST